MAAFKNKDNGTWYVQFRYTNWRGERKQKLKRGFATKREAQAWEREFLMQKQADINMTFESFVTLYEKDVKPKLTLTCCDFLYKHWTRIRTSNVIERLNREIRLRTRVVGTFRTAALLSCWSVPGCVMWPVPSGTTRST